MGEFLIMKWEWLEESLSSEELNVLYGFLNKASENKEEVRYEVCERGYNKRECPLNKLTLGKILTKEEVIESLNELGECDLEISLIEALEVLLKYVNDKEIDKSFDGIRDKTFLRNIE